MIRTLHFSGYFINKAQLAEKLGLQNAEEREIIAQGFEKQGKAFLAELNGLFAFVLYDEENGRWYCCRDRFGGRGLYYTLLPDGRPCFSGSIRDLLAASGMPAVLREEQLEVYLSYSYVPGEETLLQGIEKPLPGYCYTFAGGTVRKERYFAPRYQLENHTEKEWEDRLADVFRQIFAEQKPGGASLLSSGIDSSYLCSCLSVKDTYTATYPEKSFSESDKAGAFSGRIGAKHHAVLITPEAYLDAVPQAMRALEQPTADVSAVVLYMLCREIRRETDFCYSGEGIDELMMGYYMRYVSFIPEDQSLPEGEYIGSTQMFTEAEKKRFLKLYDGHSRKMDYTQEAYALSSGEDRYHQAALVDLMVWLNGNLLPNLYSFGEATGLHVLTPYFDNRLYDIALKIPRELQHDSTQTKKLFRMVAAKVLDEETAARPKHGFPVPIRLWIRRPDYAEKIRAAFQSAAAASFFRCDELLQYYDAMLANPEDRDSYCGIWCIYCFLVWYVEMKVTLRQDSQDSANE